MTSDLMTPREAAAQLRVSIKTLRLLVADGDLAYVNVGRGRIKGRMMFTAAALAEFVARRTQRSPPVFVTPPRSKHPDISPEVSDFLRRREARNKKKAPPVS
jgi:excisionase family DNA binding protein